MKTRTLIFLAEVMLLLGMGASIGCSRSPPGNGGTKNEERKHKPGQGQEDAKKTGSHPPRPRYVVSALAFSPDGKYLAAGYDGGEGTLPANQLQCLTLWELEHGDVVWTFRGQKQAPRVLGFSADSRWLYSAGYEGVVRGWNMATGKLERSFAIAKYENALAFSPDGKYLLSGHSEISLWDVEKGKAIYKRPFGGTVRFVSISRDGKLAFLLPTDRVSPMPIWDVKAGKPCAPTTKTANRYWMPASFDPEGRLVFSENEKDKKRFFSLWEANSGKELRSFPIDDRAWTLGFSFMPDGQSVLVVNAQEKLFRLDLKTGRKGWEQKTAYRDVQAFAVARSGKVAATFSGRPEHFPQESSLQLWETATGKNTKTLALPEPR
jgi:WD40 repeat protein